jgi:hypothetical protein
MSLKILSWNPLLNWDEKSEEIEHLKERYYEDKTKILWKEKYNKRGIKDGIKWRKKKEKE